MAPPMIELRGTVLGIEWRMMYPRHPAPTGLWVFLSERLEHNAPFRTPTIHRGRSCCATLPFSIYRTLLNPLT